MNALAGLSFPRTMAAAKEMLLSRGYHAIGRHSSQGSVFHRPGESTVFKLYSIDDHAYTAYVAFCHQHESQHFPRFGGSLNLPRYHVIQIEHLREGDDQMSQVALYFRCMLEGWPSTFDKRSIRELRMDFPNLGSEYITWIMGNPTLVFALKLLMTLKNQPDIVFDMHTDNMMLRGDTIVITDPVRPRHC